MLCISQSSYPVLPSQPSTDRNDCEDEEGAEIIYSSGDDDVEEEEDYIEAMEEEQRRFDAQLPMLILPLYSLLPAEQQAKVLCGLFQVS